MERFGVFNFVYAWDCSPTDKCLLLCGYTIDVVFHCNHADNIEIGPHSYPATQPIS